MPSGYPGVQIEYFSPNRGPSECTGVGGDAKDTRRFLRLIGWVFWNGKNFVDWIAWGKSFEIFRLEAGDMDEDWDAPRGLFYRKPFRWADYEDEYYS